MKRIATARLFNPALIGNDATHTAMRQVVAAMLPKKVKSPVKAPQDRTAGTMRREGV